jgi:hypothetical protein
LWERKKEGVHPHPDLLPSREKEIKKIEETEKYLSLS